MLVNFGKPFSPHLVLLRLNLTFNLNNKYEIETRAEMRIEGWPQGDIF